MIFSRSILARKTEPNLKLYGEILKVYPQVKFLGITFDSQLNFKKHFEDMLDHCNTRYHRLANKKWGPCPSTLIQIYKQCARPIFEYGFLSIITTSDHIISKIQWLQNKFIRLALRLPKYICPKLLHDSSGLPHVRIESSHVHPSPWIELHKIHLWKRYLPTGSILLGTLSQCHYRWSVL